MTRQKKQKILHQTISLGLNFKEEFISIYYVIMSNKFFQKTKVKRTLDVDSVWKEQLVDLGLVCGFTQVYMPLLGKCWGLAIYLMDSFAPMPDEVRQRLFYLATLILDMHRVMYLRQIFTGLRSPYMFFLILLKDAAYEYYHFALKTDANYGTLVLLIFQKPKYKILNMRLWEQQLIYFIENWVAALEGPKRLLAAFHLTMDCGFTNSKKMNPPHEKEAQTNQEEDGSQQTQVKKVNTVFYDTPSVKQEKKTNCFSSCCGDSDKEQNTVSFFFCDHMIHLKNLPDFTDEKYLILRDMHGPQRREAVSVFMQ